MLNFYSTYYLNRAKKSLLKSKKELNSLNGIKANLEKRYKESNYNQSIKADIDRVNEMINKELKVYNKTNELSFNHVYKNKKDTRKLLNFIFDEFCIALKDKLIKNEYNPIPLGLFGLLLITMKKPKMEYNDNGKLLFSVDWQKSRKYREELIAQGTPVKGKGQDGVNWLIPKFEEYPILNYIKRKKGFTNPVLKYKETISIFSRILFKANRRFIGEIYAYRKLNPSIEEGYKTKGNGWYNKIVKSRNLR